MSLICSSNVKFVMYTLFISARRGPKLLTIDYIIHYIIYLTLTILQNDVSNNSHFRALRPHLIPLFYLCHKTDENIYKSKKVKARGSVSYFLATLYHDTLYFERVANKPI